MLSTRTAPNSSMARHRLVVKFTNGLTAYLSGDTAIHAEMKTVINEFHKANLAVLNLGPNPGIFISGAHAMNELVRPAMARWAGALRCLITLAVCEAGRSFPRSVAGSGCTMDFDGQGKCVAGC